MITEDKWYCGTGNKFTSVVEAYNGYDVRLSDAVCLVDFFIAYRKLIPVWKEISCGNSLLLTKLYYGEGVLQTDIYVREHAVKDVRKALEEAGELAEEIQCLHCQVKSLETFTSDYHAYTECYAGGMLYRIMDTHF